MIKLTEFRCRLRGSSGVTLPFEVFAPLNNGRWTIPDAGHRAKVDFGDVVINGAMLEDGTEKSAMRALVFASAAHQTAEDVFGEFKREEEKHGTLQIFADDPSKRTNLSARRDFQLAVRKTMFLYGFSTEAFLALYQGRKMDPSVFLHLSKFALPYTRSDDREQADDKEQADRQMTLKVHEPFVIPPSLKATCTLEALQVDASIRSTSAITEGSCEASINLGDIVVDGKGLKDPLLREAFTAVLMAIVAAKTDNEPLRSRDDDEQADSDVIKNVRSELLVIVTVYTFLALYKGEAMPKRAFQFLATLAEQFLQVSGKRDTLVN